MCSKLQRTVLKLISDIRGNLACVGIYIDNIAAKNFFDKFGFIYYRDLFYHPIILKRYPLYFADTRCAVLDLSRPIPKVMIRLDVLSTLHRSSLRTWFSDVPSDK